MSRILPKRPTGNSSEAKYHQRLWDVINSLVSQIAPKMLTSVTTRGVFQVPSTRGGSGGGPSAILQFKGQWNPESAYAEGDIVIRAEDNEILTGNLIGTYIANTDIGSGALVEAGEHPSYPLHSLSKWDLFSIVPSRRMLLRAGDQIIDIRAGALGDDLSSVKLELNNDRTAEDDVGPRVILDLNHCGTDVIRIRPIPLCEVDVATGTPTIGWRYFLAGPFHPGSPPPPE